MKRLTPNDAESHSADIVAENVERLKELFPEIVTEGSDGASINVDVLKQLVGDKTVTDADEKFGLNWFGKRAARRLALTPSTGTLRPCREESVAWETTQNLMIEGDNLEVLKLLQKSYTGKVKLIYIDPPYNTGRDFIYRDDFRDNIRNYQRMTGQVDEEGSPLASNTEASGRFHTDWLNMMYPRLKVAAGLLRKDGALFLSCDDNEVADLRLLLDEIFGGENFVATVIWQKVYAPKNSARHFSADHDFILVYARNSDLWRPSLLPRTEEMEARYINLDNDPRGPWKPSDLSARNYYSEGVYSVTCPSGRVIEGPPAGTYWRVSPERFDELNLDGRIWWGKDGNNVPALKRFLSEVQQGRVPQTLWPYTEVGHTQDAKKELMDLVPFQERDNVLDTVKPASLIRRILQIATTTADDLVLDFFAGAAPTGQAVYEQNADDGGRRRFVLVQIPETLPKPEPKLKTLTDITKERLRHAADKIREENPMFAGDLGLRVFKLDSSNIRAWDPWASDVGKEIDDKLEHLKGDRDAQDILYEILLKLGLDLCATIEDREIAGRVVSSVGGGVLMACLADAIDKNNVDELAEGIAEWHEELAPPGETTCIFRDSAFANDVVKTNVTAILKQHDIEIVRSL